MVEVELILASGGMEWSVMDKIAKVVVDQIGLDYTTLHCTHSPPLTPLHSTPPLETPPSIRKGYNIPINFSGRGEGNTRI